jgi:hypothetical protein
MSNRCECGHHRLTHTYTREANIGPCEGWADAPPESRPERCACDKYEEEK